ncbi:MAG: DUF4823 domain-containing protein [Verrucomicrobia bacterium]|nr:DUF4823 domain-containing protein [Verrucomicrobiota bacterium]
MKPIHFSLFSAVALMLIFAGCQHTYDELRSDGVAERPRLKSAAIAYVPIPPDLRFKGEFVQDSGKKTAYALQDEFAKYFRRVYVGRRVETLDESLATAREFQCDYCIYATVIRWEDRSTENTGLRDKLEIQIQIVDSVSEETLDKTVLKGKSRLMTDGGDSPADLLLEPIRNYAASFFNPIATPSALK